MGIDASLVKFAVHRNSRGKGHAHWALFLIAVCVGSAMGQSLGRPEEVDSPSVDAVRTVPRAEARSVESPQPVAQAAEGTWEGAAQQAAPATFWTRVNRAINPWAKPDDSAQPEDAGSVALQQDSLWMSVKRKMGWAPAKEPPATMVRGKDGRWQALPTDRAVDRYANAEFVAAEDLFRKEDYSGARKAFRSLAKKYKDQPLEEDVLFMLAECEFKLDRLPSAQDSYHKLLTKYPTTRYMPQAVQRSYDIAYYWLEDSRLRAEGKPSKYTWSRYVNLFDRTRPLFDTAGRALDTVEVIQQYDPFGPLTDDAMMMAGADRFISDDYIQAAGYYEQLVADQPRSEHHSKAKILCEQSFLRSYRGPQYDASDLDGAHRMAKAALETAESYSSDQQRRLEADLRAIHLERAKRDFITGEDFRHRWLYTSAKYYYRQVIDKYPDTDWARKAEEMLREVGDKETKHFHLTDYVRWPFSGMRTPRMAMDPFKNHANDPVTTATPSEEDVPVESEAVEETEEESPPAEKKPFRLRNWLDQL